MIVRRESTIIDYPAPFDQGLSNQRRVQDVMRLTNQIQRKLKLKLFY